MSRSSRRSGFTLIEAGVVLGFLALLAAITIPNLAGARSSIGVEDGKKVLNALAVEESTYFLRFGEFITADPNNELGASVGLTTADASVGNVSLATSSLPGVDGAGPVSDLGMALITSDGICLTLRVADPNSGMASSTGQFTVSGSTLACNGSTAIGQSGVMW